MTAIAPTQRYSAHTSQTPEAGIHAARRENPSCVVESSGDEPWGEFCKGLKEPAFLLAVTGFGDLD